MQFVKALMLLSILLATMFPVMAQEATETPRVAPDQPVLWDVKRAIENIDEFLTLNKAEKAEKGLAHARERLLEVQKMIEEKNLAAAAKGEQAHKRKIERVKQTLEEVSASDPTQELEKEIELERQITEQEVHIKRFKQEIEIKIKGTLTSEQQAQLDALLASFEGTAASVKIKIETEKGKTKLKIKTKIEENESELEEEKDLEETTRELEKLERELAEENSEKSQESFEKKEDDDVKGTRFLLKDPQNMSSS